MISGRAHAQEFMATHPQGSLRHAESRAKLGHVQPWANMCGQRIFEPDHDIRMVSPRFEIAVCIVSRQAVDKRMQQFLFKSSCDLRMLNWFISGFSEPTNS